MDTPSGMDNTPTPAGNSKMWLWGVLAVIIIAVLAFVLAKAPAKPVTQNNTQTNTQSQPEVPKVATKEVAKDQLPDAWPTDIPMEAGAKVTVNYQKTLDDGSVQLVQAFTSAKTVADNGKIYTDYFASAGFKLAGQIDQPTFKSYAATKGNEQLQVLIQQDAKTKVVTVNITVTFATKPF